MVIEGGNRKESIGPQREDQFVNLERRRDREVARSPNISIESVHSNHISQSHLRPGSHISREQEACNLRLEIDHLRKQLRRRVHVREDRTPSPSQISSSKGERSYRQRSKTPPRKYFITPSRSRGGEGYHQRRDRNSPPENMGNDAISKAGHQISRSPFSSHIERTKIPHCFTQPTFTIYNEKIDLMEHVRHFNQRMTIYSRNKALMCKVFPSSLEPIAMRWFGGLEESSIGSYKELTKAFNARFVTCSRIPKPLDSLLSMAMRKGETLKTYSDRYQELFIEIDGDFEDVAVRTFKVELPMNSDLRKSMKPTWNMHQLMDRIDEYKRVEDDKV